MRNLTLGVLIAVGGTLAAVPFRRDGGTPDASRQPTHATGPIESVFDQPSMQSLVTEDPIQMQRREITRDLAELIGPSFQSAASNLSHHQSGSAFKRRRQSPLTFEDLLEPIERPSSVKERLEAVAEVRQDRSVLPSPQALAEASQDFSGGRFQKIDPLVEQTRKKTIGSLASVSRSEMIPPQRISAEETTLTFVQRLPKPTAPSEPSRHWIQQP